MLRIGGFKIVVVRDGFFALDGGAMFGTVPKVLWERLTPSDARNRIRLGLYSLLLCGNDSNILVDTGIGDKFSKKYQEIYGIEKSPGLLSDLEAKGIQKEDVDILILTHLHFDHAGGATEWDEEGRSVPIFRDAVTFIQRSEWEAANSPDRRSRASYISENIEPLRSLQKLNLISGNYNVAEGLTIIETGGHTRGHQVVTLEDEASFLIFWGDIIPTRNHIKLPYVMAYDTEPLVTMKVKENLFAQIIEKGKETYFFFEHDPRNPLVKVVNDGGEWKIIEDIL